MGLGQLQLPRTMVPAKQWAVMLSRTLLSRAFGCNRKLVSIPLKFLVEKNRKRTFSLIGRSYSADSPITFCSIESEPVIREEDLGLPEPPNVYKEALRLCHESQSEFYSVSAEAKEIVQTIQPIGAKARGKHIELQAFLFSFPEGTDPRHILKAFAKKNDSRRPDMRLYSQIIHIYGLCGNYRRAQAMFDLMLVDKYLPDAKAYVSLMNAYANGGNLKKTTEIFQFIRAHPDYQSPHPYSILIKCYMKHRLVQDAFNVIELMKEKMSPDVQTYDSLIQACLEAEDYERAWVAYNMMLKDGCKPDVGTYSSMIAIAQRKNIRTALKLFERLLRLDIVPNSDCIHSLLSALSTKPEYFSTTLDLLNLLTSRKAFQPTTATFNILLRGAALSRDLGYARIFFDKVRLSNPDPRVALISFSNLFEAYSLAFPSDSCERRIPSFPANSTFSYLQRPPPTCIDACVVEAMLTLPFLDSVPVNNSNDTIRPHMFFLAVLANYNYFDAAISHFEAITKNFHHHLHPQFFSCMLRMCYKLRKERSFWDILGKTDSLLAPIQPTSSLSKLERIQHKHTYQLSPRPLESMYQSIIVGLAEFHNLTKALDYFEAMLNDEDIPWRSKGKHYVPFFEAVYNSSDPNLTSRLIQLLKPRIKSNVGRVTQTSPT